MNNKDNRQWERISEAPQNTKVIIYRVLGPGFWMDMAINDGRGWLLGKDTLAPYVPTHFMRLPNPPDAEQEVCDE